MKLDSNILTQPKIEKKHIYYTHYTHANKYFPQLRLQSVIALVVIFWFYMIYSMFYFYLKTLSARDIFMEFMLFFLLYLLFLLLVLFCYNSFVVSNHGNKFKFNCHYSLYDIWFILVCSRIYIFMLDKWMLVQK